MNEGHSNLQIRLYNLNPFILQSDGLDHTRILARKHADEALRHISPFAQSPEKQALIILAEMTLNRKK